MPEAIFWTARPNPIVINGTRKISWGIEVATYSEEICLQQDELRINLYLAINQNNIDMKRILLALLCLGQIYITNGQDAVFSEDFQGFLNGEQPFEFIQEVDDAVSTDWLSLDLDDLPANASAPGDWYVTTDFNHQNVEVVGDSNIVMASQSWLVGFAPGNSNLLITPEITVPGAGYVLRWTSGVFQTPRYADGYRVLISPDAVMANNVADFTDEVFVQAQMVEDIAWNTDEYGDIDYTGCATDGGLDVSTFCWFPEVYGDGTSVDSDMDQTPDYKDKCPFKKGKPYLQGCPPTKDTDGDGVFDDVDDCPTIPGPISNNGCPTIPESVLQELNYIAKNIYFETSKTTIKPRSYGDLTRIADILQEFPNVRFYIDGHTDNQGNDTYNLALSRRRAAVVVTFLENKGVDGRQLESRGFGESRPIESNSSPGGRQLNRRVEIQLISPDQN